MYLSSFTILWLFRPATNSTVIHSISSTFIFVRKLNFSPFPGNFFEKVNSLLVDQNSLISFDQPKENSLFRKEISWKGAKI